MWQITGSFTTWHIGYEFLDKKLSHTTHLTSVFARGSNRSKIGHLHSGLIL